MGKLPARHRHGLSGLAGVDRQRVQAAGSVHHDLLQRRRPHESRSVGDRPQPRRRRGESVFRHAGSARRPRDLAHRRPCPFLEAHELSGHRNQRANDRLGLAHAISTVPGPTPSGRLRASGGGREHGVVLALVVAPLWPGDVLEGRAVARSRAEPRVCGSLARRGRTRAVRSAAREPREGRQGRHPVQRRLRQRDPLHAVQRPG